MTAYTFALAMAALGVNGPEDAAPDWDAIYWRTHEDHVRRLRQRIFKATKDGDLKKVRNLQKLMLRSRSNTLVSVRQVTQRNAGRKTAGVDGEVALTSRDRGELAERLHRHASPLQSPAGQADLHSEGEWETASAGNSGARGPRAAGTCQERAGARVGGPVRAEILRIPAWTGRP